MQDKILILEDLGDSKDIPGGDRYQSHDSTLLRIISDNGQERQTIVDKYASGLRWEEQTGLLYEHRIGGFGVLDREGRYLYEIPNLGDTAQPALEDGILYVMCEEFGREEIEAAIYALKHPDPSIPSSDQDDDDGDIPIPAPVTRPKGPVAASEAAEIPKPIEQ